ncbi:TlpA family protein disulfide reductase [Mucilaginibacter phyllosphaerae]|uniref:Thiol-disulfide isomerase/thioredoxin n=1 Tax=Mucilaginibacter phyllosphaerae TaxID=1812349 RepID=A0ABR6I8Q8_9SPHI|nr:TlpA disulfide reductase family protein [Mucilaginibacter phyllosphaerae]MBB3969415.1 thiol-disulfide isomerase/thioredoxin [Mucilaginibacter phyllosphaerae]GGH08365.1 hypothetical protein GCM10007352_13450 [Mucilaginibacter phyllosphaerae]
MQNRYDLSSSSADQSKLNEFNSLAKRITDTVKHQRLYYINLSDDALLKNKDALYRKYLDTITQMDECINNANLAAIHQFIVKNPNTLITPYLITNVYDLFERYAFYKKVLDGLSPAVKQTKYYNEANELLQSVKNIYIGAEASPINGKTLKGDDFKISYANKKIILVDFWASYCAPCRQQTPDLKVIYNKYKSKGFDIVSVSIDEDAMKWKRASAQDSIPWHNVAECVDQSDSKNIRNFVVKSIPANYVLNNKGRLIGRNVELDSLERMLKKL